MTPSSFLIIPQQFFAFHTALSIRLRLGHNLDLPSVPDTLYMGPENHVERHREYGDAEEDIALHINLNGAHDGHGYDYPYGHAEFGDGVGVGHGIVGNHTREFT